MRLWEDQSISTRVEEVAGKLEHSASLQHMQGLSNALGNKMQALQSLCEGTVQKVSLAVDKALSWMAEHPQDVKSELVLVIGFLRSASVSEDHKQWHKLLEVFQLARSTLADMRALPEQQAAEVDEFKSSVESYSKALRSLEETTKGARCRNVDRHRELTTFLDDVHEDVKEMRRVLREHASKLIEMLGESLAAKTVALHQIA